MATLTVTSVDLDAETLLRSRSLGIPCFRKPLSEEVVSELLESSV